MRAGHAFAEDAPETALLLMDGSKAADGDDRRLQRLVADAGRHGFHGLRVIHKPEMGPFVDAALKALPILSPLPEIAAEASDSPFASLAAHLPRCGPRTLVLEGLGARAWNWLDLMAGVAPSRAGAIALEAAETGNAAFALTREGMATTAPGPDGLAFAGLAILERHALDGCADAGSLDSALRRLADAGWLAGRRLPATAPRDAVPDLREARPALFLDRDGTLNVDYGYVYDPERLVFLPGAAAAVKRANDLGFYVFLVTNQSGVGRGYYTEPDVHRCNGTLQRHLRAFGAHLDDIRYCADHPDALIEHYRRPSGWRKPAPGMLLDLMEHWPVTRAGSLMVGDKDSDVAAGHAAGIASLKFEGGDLDAFLAPHLLARLGDGDREAALR